MAENSSTTSSFDVSGVMKESEEKSKKRYSDLNLWLYRLDEKADEKGFHKGKADKQYFWFFKGMEFLSQVQFKI